MFGRNERHFPDGGFPWKLLLAAVIALSLVAAVALFRGRGAPATPQSTSTIEVRPSPNVVLAIRDLARLETASYHMERVVEMSDEQTHLWGTISTKDVILLIAVGDVAAGVDLQKLRDEDVTTD